MMYNRIWFEQLAAAEGSMVFESDSSLDWFIECPNKEHQKKKKTSLDIEKSS